MIRRSWITERERTQTSPLTHVQPDIHITETRSGESISQEDYWCSYITVCCENIQTEIIYLSHLSLHLSVVDFR